MSYFTLEINDFTTRMSRGRRRGSKVELEALGSMITASNFFDSESKITQDEQIQTLKRLHDSLHIRESETRVILPDTHAFSQIIEMPYMNEKELSTAIRYQADELIPMPIDSTYLDLTILKNDTQNKKMLVLLVASAKSKIDRLFDAVQNAGFYPLSLENELTALARYFNEYLLPKKGNYLIVNIGFKSSSLYVVEDETFLVNIIRTSKVGYELFYKDLKINLNWEDEKIHKALTNTGLGKTGDINLGSILLPVVRELVQEIQRLLSVYEAKTSKKIEQIYVTNFDSHIKFLDVYIQNYFHITTSTIPLFQHLVQNNTAKSFFSRLSEYSSLIAGYTYE